MSMKTESTSSTNEHGHALKAEFNWEMFSTPSGNIAGIATVQVPADVALDPDVAPLVDGSGNILGDPAWAVVAIDDARVGLTPFGRYFVRLNLLAEGTHAPLLESV